MLTHPSSGTTETLTHTNERYDIPNQTPDADGIVEVLMIPTQNIVVYPDTVRPLTISTRAAEAAIEQALVSGLTAGIFTMKNTDQPIDGDNLYPFGTEVALQTIPPLDGLNSAMVQGRRRLEFVELTQKDPYYVCRARVIYSNGGPPVDTRAQAHMRAAITLFRRVISLNADIPGELLVYAREQDNPGQLADLIANSLTLTVDERQSVLATADPTERIRLILTLLGKELTMLEIEEQIESQIQQDMAREQRELYLREQMRVIQNELGETDVFEREVNELRERVHAADLPPEAKSRALKEISRLAMMPPMTPEIGLIHTYIDWLVSIPWNNASVDNLDITHAKQVLDEDHYGLPRVKDRVLEHIAVRKLAAEKMQTPILCFLGPPGTGKTSLGKSIARALGRSFARVSLGGVRDEAEIRGHRRTYIGALPGRIIQTMRRAGTVNPVIMLDEIDKLGMDFHGDPAAALLEVLDPEQNTDFFDHYLDVPYDLSQVMFITTANDLYPLPLALEDRLEVIEFPGYIEEEKLAIAQEFLIPKQLEAHGLNSAGMRFETSSLQTMIREYTYEAGVRSLNRRIAEVMRKTARLRAEDKKHPRRITSAMLTKTLGPPDYTAMRANDEDQVGVATGLAWTSNGGDVMTIEVSLLPGKGSLMLTGQLGDVMQESAQAALSYMRARADDLNIPHDDFDNYDLHIHLPEGAIPKDGPSAGVTLAIAIISVFTERKIRSDFAMTGEITLRGKVLPVGGIREKVMAARRAQLKNIIIPSLNLRDLIEVPTKAIKALNIIPAEDMQTLMDAVLLPAPEVRQRDMEDDNEDEEEAETET